MKRCYKCGEAKEDREFWKNQTICKGCGRIRNQEYKQAIKGRNTDILAEFPADQTKKCAKCHQIKQLQYFRLSPGGAFGRRSDCKSCNLVYKRDLYHRKHPDAPYNDYPHYSDTLDCIAKVCSQCKIEKPVTEFYTRPGGYHAPCKECDKALHKLAYDVNPEKYRARSREWIAQHPDESRERHQKWQEANKERLIVHWRRYHAAHKEQRNAYDRQRHAIETPEYRAKEYRKRREYFVERHRVYREWLHQYERYWRQLNPDKHADSQQRRRARKMASPYIEKINRNAIIERDNGVCYLCGNKPTGRDLTLDHVIPLFHGGPHAADNLRVACRTCNSRKGAKILGFLP